MKPRTPQACPALQDEERCLDDALAATFPASDPVASWAGHDRAPEADPPQALEPLWRAAAEPGTDAESEADGDERRLAEGLVESFPCSDAPSTWAGPPRG